MVWKFDEPRCGAGTLACRVDTFVDVLRCGPSSNRLTVNEWNGMPLICATFRLLSEKRRDESRRSRQECPRHEFGSHTFHDLRRSEGSTTPAKPGKTVVLYANGFGATSTPVVDGAVKQSGTLSPLPVVK